MSGPLAGWRVAIFRSAEQAERMASAVEATGAEVLVVPLVRVVEARDEGRALREALTAIDRFDWIVFTSANGARAVTSSLTIAAVPHLGVAAVGAATAGALRDEAVSVHFVPSASTAASLASELPPRGRNRVLAPLAELAGADLVEGLTRRGFTVDRVEAYRLAAVEPTSAERVALSEVDALVFTSPSIVDRYRSLGLPHGDAIIVSIGPRTTRQLEIVGMTPTIEASPHDTHGVVAALSASLDRPPTS